MTDVPSWVFNEVMGPTDFDSLTIHRWANPNNLGLLATYTAHERGQKEFGVFVYYSDDYEPDYIVCLSEEQRDAVYESRVAELRETPNWEAQREYDEAHGTINGEDPGVAMMRELWGDG